MPLWASVGAGVVFLSMFTGLVVTTTLLVVNTRETQALRETIAVEEPVAAVFESLPAAVPEVADAAMDEIIDDAAAPEPEVTRTSVDLLGGDLAETEAPSPRPQVRLADRIQLPNCIDYLDTLAKITQVRFPLGSNEPSEADLPRVRNMATALRLCPDVKLIVEGHSDRRGSDKLNMDLSWYRAETVLQILRDEGFDTAQMEPLGFGARRPINLSGTVSGEGENRRVQFQLVPRDTVVDDRLVRN